MSDSREQDQSGKWSLAGWLGGLAHWAADHPLPTLLATLLITVVTGWLATTKLSFRTSRLDLLSPNSSYNQRWLRYLDKFGRDDDAAVVITGDNPQQVSAALAAVGQRLSLDSRLPHVLYQRHLGAVPSKALNLLPTSMLAEIAHLLANCRELVANLNNQGDLADRGTTDTGAIDARRLSVSLASSSAIPQSLLDGLQRAQLGMEQLANQFPSHAELLLEDQGRMGLCVVRMPHPDEQPEKSAEILNCLKAHMARAQKDFPSVQFGLTGMPILEWDESISSQRDMQSATYLSLLGVAIIFVIGFGSWRLPVCAIVCLAISLIWTLGISALVVGHLNLFSIAFGAILAGLGIDYSIHTLTRLQSLVQSNGSVTLGQAIRISTEQCGCGIVSGALTTAVAFLAAAFTPFRGIAELGIITAIGVMVCMLVTLFALPALIAWQSQFYRSNPRKADTWFASLTTSRGPHWLNRCMDVINRLAIASPKSSLAGAGVLTIIASIFAFSVYYDHDLLNLQAADAESVRTEQELIRRSGPSTWFAVSVADSPARARWLRERFMQLPSVVRVEEVGSLFQNAEDQPIRGQLVDYCRICAGSLATEIQRATGRSSSVSSSESLVTPAAYLPSLAGNSLPSAMIGPLQKLTDTISKVAASGPLQPSDLPHPVSTRMVSQDGQSFLLRIFARDDIWKRENLERFVRDVESVDRQVTGHPVQTFYASAELHKSYLHAGLYALLLVMALLMLDLGSVRLLLVAMIPVLLGGLQMMGILGGLEIPLNAANMIVLPLILGIGIDNGIHIVHEYKRDRRNFRLSSVSAVSILLTSVTTMIGFGCVGLSDHRGLQGLGIVLVLGVGLCLVNSLLVLPPLLTLLGQRFQSAGDLVAGDLLTAEPSRKENYLRSLGITESSTPLVLSLPQCPAAESRRFGPT